MKKAPRIGCIVVASLAGLVVLALVLLTVLLNSRAVARLLDKYAAEYIDGELEHGSIRVSPYRHFPVVGITLEDVALTYPHERFSPYDTLPAPSPLLDAGRGASKDTLARFGTLDAAVNLLSLLRGEIRVEHALLDRFAAFAHHYGEAANWDILHFPQPEKKEPFNLPRIDLKELRIEGRPQVVYTAQREGVFATLRFLQFSLQGDVRWTPEASRIRDVHLALDSLHLFGHIPQDTLAVKLERLRIDEPGNQAFDLSLIADALVNAQDFGRLDVPVRMDGSVNFARQGGRTDLGVDRLDLRVAQLPLHLEGRASLLPDQTDINASATLSDCPLDSLLRLYLDHYLQISRDLSTDARLSVDVSANGTWSKESFPDIVARLRVPESHSRYRPFDLNTTLEADISATMDAQKRLDARINRLTAGIPGANIQLDGSAADLLGGNARFSLHALGDARIAQLRRFLPARFGITKAGGDARLDLNANVSESELRKLRFEGADINGTLRSNLLYASVPVDTIDARLAHTNIRIGANRNGLRLNVGFDSLSLDKGAVLHARIRDMRDGAQLTKVAVREKMVPHAFLSISGREIFAQLDSHRISLANPDVWISSTQRVPPDNSARKRKLDALQQQYPDVPRADLAARLMERDMHRPPRPHQDFAHSDLAIELNESIQEMFRQWSSTGGVVVDSGYFASPRLPLRTQLTALDASFTDNSLTLDSLGVTSGTSDLQVNGYLNGLQAITSPRSRQQLDAQMNLSSQRININELMAALEAGKPDSLRDAPRPREAASLVVVPGNVRATVGLQVDSVDVAEFQFGPVLAAARIQDRTAQILGTRVFTEMGHIGLDGYYSTQSKEDISAGVNLELKEVSIPNVVDYFKDKKELPPLLTSMQGRLNCNLSATTQLDTNMNVVIPTLDGLVRLSGHELEVRDAGKLRRLTRLLMFRDKNIGPIDDLDINVVAHNAQLELFPFELGVDRYRLAIMGMQGLDKSLYYHASILRSPLLIRFGINISGTLDHWRFTFSRPRYRDGKLPVFTQQLDSVQINIAQSIRDIFDTGVKRVRDYNLTQEYDLLRSGDEMLDHDEYKQVDDLLLSVELGEQEEALDAEVQEILDASTRETDAQIRQYTEQVLQKKKRTP